MKLELHIADENSLWPEAAHALRRIPEAATYHHEWGLRQPLGLYNSSLSNLPRRFENVLDALDTLRSIPSEIGKDAETARTRLLDAHKALLYALLEHLEDCRNLTKSFFPKSSFTDKEDSVRAFKTAWDKFRDPLGHIVNTMKHRQGRLGFFQAATPMMKIPGYSVQVALQRDTIGPDPQIHGLTSSATNRVAAVSFNHDLRHHFCTVYAIGYYVTQYVRTVYTGLSSTDSASNPPCPWAFDIASRIQKLLPFVYPHETAAPVPVVETAPDHPLAGNPSIRGRMIRIELSDTIRPPTFNQMPGGRVSLMAQFEGDGATRSFKVP